MMSAPVATRASSAMRDGSARGVHTWITSGSNRVMARRASRVIQPWRSNASGMRANDGARPSTIVVSSLNGAATATSTPRGASARTFSSM